MAKNGFRVMDSDMHIVEPADLWQRYIDPAFRDRAPVGTDRHPRDLGVQVGEHVFPLPNRSYDNAIQPLMTSQQDVYVESERQGWDSASQLTAMDNEGIDVAVLFPSRGCLRWVTATSTRRWPPPSRGPTTTGWPTSAAAALRQAQGGACSARG